MKNYLHEGAIGNEEMLTLLNKYDSYKQVGGQASFFGRVRADIISDKEVAAIEYSAYETMANSEFDKLETEFKNRYPDIKSISLLHAIGKLKVGETAMAVVISGGHRKQVFLAVQEIVDEIKARIPIWKKEILTDGEYVWTENA